MVYSTEQKTLMIERISVSIPTLHEKTVLTVN
jgi:hypothetical protein